MLMLLVCLLSSFSVMAQKVDRSDYFYVLDARHGLSDNCILQMLQLPDGRLAVRTGGGVNIYDGKRFKCIPLDSGKDTLMAYRGQTHLYVDKHGRLLIKDYRQLHAIDIRRATRIEHPLDAVIRDGGAWEADDGKGRKRTTGNGRGEIDDVFVDSQMDTWIVKGDSMVNIDNRNAIRMEKSWGELQDMDSDGRYVYTFHDTGIVAVFQNGKLVYTAKAYDSSEAQKYRGTSLISKTPDGQFYQIRTGHVQGQKGGTSIFLRFDTAKRKFTTIFSCDYILHTLNMSSGKQALVSSQRGYLMFDFNKGNTPREVRDLSLPDGRSLTTGINTVYRDRDGVIWLGTYNDGLISISPMLGLFFTAEKPWWQSGWNVMAFIALLVCVGGCTAYLVVRKRRAGSDGKPAGEDIPAQDISGEDNMESQEDVLIRKARCIVERHLNDTEYGVEQLAHDLCMERTGLYKKLTALTGTSPVVFIRCIRLQRAAELLKESKLTINEIAALTGFSSPSYFAKCFKKEYGVSPSDYCRRV